MSNYKLLESYIEKQKFPEFKSFFTKNGLNHGLKKDEINSLLIKSVLLLLKNNTFGIEHISHMLSSHGMAHNNFPDYEGEVEIDINALTEISVILIENGADYSAHAGKTKRSAKLNDLVLRKNPEMHAKLQAVHDKKLMKSRYSEIIETSTPASKRLF